MRRHSIRSPLTIESTLKRCGKGLAPDLLNFGQPKSRSRVKRIARPKRPVDPFAGAGRSPGSRSGLENGLVKAQPIVEVVQRDRVGKNRSVIRQTRSGEDLLADFILVDIASDGEV